MKEATGELNMTVITVVAIAAVAAFFYAFVWPAIKNNINSGNNCANSFACEEGDENATTVTCKYCPGGGFDCETPSEVKCPKNY